VTRRLRNVIWNQDASSFLETSPLKTKFVGLNSKAEELQEVSSHLSLLRKKHDESSEFILKQQLDLDLLKFEVKQLSQIENAGTEGVSRLEERVRKAEARVAETKTEQAETSMAMDVYEHMLERMKQTQIYLEIKAQDLKQSLRNKRLILKEELERHQRVREVKAQARSALDKIKRAVEYDLQEKQGHLTSLEEDRRLKEDNTAKREERQRNQLEITERTANEDRDVEEKRMKDSLRLHIMWGNFLDKKLQMEHHKSSSLQEAFQQMKAASGLTDMTAMIERLFTRERTYAQIVGNVKYSEQRLAEVQADNIELMAKITKLKAEVIEDEHSSQKQELARLAADNTEHTYKADQVGIVYEKVYKWTERMLSKLRTAESGAEVNSSEDKPSLLTVFFSLKDLALKLLEGKHDLKAQLDLISSEKLNELAVRTR
jgi:hypothetical protein